MDIKDTSQSGKDIPENKESYVIKKERLWQGISAFLVIVVIFMFFFKFGGDKGSPSAAAVVQPDFQQPDVPEQGLPSKVDVELDDDAVLGDANAPVTIVSFEDYQCPFCGRSFTQTFPLLKKEYIDTGKAKVVFRDFPLSFHPEAQPAAEASECSHEQGKFWEYHDKLFENQANLGQALYIKLAEDLKLDMQKFKSCIEAGKYKKEVQDDFAYGTQVGVSGTPTFFINGIKLVGAQPYQSFKQIIDSELAN